MTSIRDLEDSEDTPYTDYAVECEQIRRHNERQRTDLEIVHALLRSLPETPAVADALDALGRIHDGMFPMAARARRAERMVAR